jgi:hypothetical protein
MSGIGTAKKEIKQSGVTAMTITHLIGKMQPVIGLTYPPMEGLYDILIIIVLSILTIQLRKLIEQSMLMRYYQFYEENCILLKYE